MTVLGKLINNYYTLTNDGKSELLHEVNNRIFNNKSNTYEDKYFEKLVSFVVENSNKTISQALEYGLNGNEKQIYKLIKRNQNKRKIEQWFEANVNDTNILGEEIVNYFKRYLCHENESNKFDVSLLGLTKIIRKSINENNSAILYSIKPNFCTTNSNIKKHTI